MTLARVLRRYIAHRLSLHAQRCPECSWQGGMPRHHARPAHAQFVVLHAALSRYRYGWYNNASFRLVDTAISARQSLSCLFSYE